MATSDEVRLAVPAMPEYLRLARVTAAGLASRLGFSFDEVEDLRLAIDELCYGLTGNSGRPGTVAVRYLVSDDSLVVEGEGHFDDVVAGVGLGSGVGGSGGGGGARRDGGGGGRGGESGSAPAASLSELSQVILAALVDEHELSDGPGGPRFRLVKRRDPLTRAADGGGNTTHP